MNSYKIHNEKNEDLQCVFIGEDQTYESKNFIFYYDSSNNEITIQTSPTKSDMSNAIDWEIDSTEYLPFVKKCQVYKKKKNIGGIDSISGIHVAKCGSCIFIISSKIEIDI